MTAASLEKLPCHVDFPHISSIALFTYINGLGNQLIDFYIENSQLLPMVRVATQAHLFVYIRSE